MHSTSDAELSKSCVSVHATVNREPFKHRKTPVTAVVTVTCSHHTVGHRSFTSYYGSRLYGGVVSFSLSLSLFACVAFFLRSVWLRSGGALRFNPQAAVSGADPVKAGGLRGCSVGDLGLWEPWAVRFLRPGVLRIQRNWRRHSEYHKVVTMRTPSCA